MNLTLSQLFTHLLSERNFYIHVANGMPRIEVPGMPTMAVGIYQGRMTLFVGPDFIKNVSLGMGIYVLEHEMYHVVMDHIPRLLEAMALHADEGMRDRVKAVANIAMDCADNTNLRGSKYFSIAVEETKAMCRAGRPDKEADDKDGMVLPEHYDLRKDGSYEFYQNELLKKAGQAPRRGRGDGGLTDEEMEALEQILQDAADKVGDSHSRWTRDQADGEDLKAKGEGEPGDGDAPSPDKVPQTSEQLRDLAERIRTQTKRLLRKAVTDTKRDRGTIPSDIEEWLSTFLADPIIPWWELLTSRVRAAKRSKPERGIQRPNRMLLAMSEEDGAIIPSIGRTRDPRFRVFFMEDTSGSMRTDELQIAFSELNHLMRSDDDIEVRYIQGDARVHFDKVLKTGDPVPAEVHGRGGTDFESYFEYMAQYCGNDETAPDIIIVYTDAGCPAPGVESRLSPEIPVIWLVTPGNTGDHLRQSGYGEVIICDKAQSETWGKAA